MAIINHMMKQIDNDVSNLKQGLQPESLAFWYDKIIKETIEMAPPWLQDKIKVQSWHEFISQPLWNNNRIRIGNKSVFHKTWFDKNIIYISDLLDEKGCFYSLENLQKIYGIKTNFLIYASLQKSIKTSLTTLKIPMGTNNPKPFVPINIKIFCTNKRGTKQIYNTLISETITPLGQTNWENLFNSSESQWEKTHLNPFQYTKNSKLQWLQYRITNHILTTNSFVFKIGIVDTKLCCFCKSSEETIVHLLWDCPKVQELISSFITIGNSKGISTLH